MLCTPYSCQIFMKIEFSSHILEKKYSNIKFHEKSFQWEDSVCMRADRRTDEEPDRWKERHDETISRFSQFCERPPLFQWQYEIAISWLLSAPPDKLRFEELAILLLAVNIIIFTADTGEWHIRCRRWLVIIARWNLTMTLHDSVSHLEALRCVQ